MSALKYNVGDRVIVRKELNQNETYGGWNATYDMVELAGEEVTIESTDSDELFGGYYRIDKSVWGWTDEMFSGFAIPTAKCDRSDQNTKKVEFTPGKIEELYSL